MILRNPLTSPVRGARQNGRAPSRAFGRAQKAIYAGSIRIPQDAGYRGYAEDIQLEQQLIRKLLYSPTGLSTFFLEFVQNWFAFSKKPSVLIFGYVPILPETLLFSNKVRCIGLLESSFVVVTPLLSTISTISKQRPEGKGVYNQIRTCTHLVSGNKLHPS